MTVRMIICSSLVILVSCIICTSGQIRPDPFPNDFLFGAATSAYQIEGAWNIGGKGENIWDRYTHDYPEEILDGSSGDIACNSYYKFREDVALLKNLGVNFYRFSLSWSRILPTGLAYKVNPDGIRFYNQLIDELIANDIEPMITLFHWDTPQPLENLGGFTNDLFPIWFEDFARVAYDNFGGRVKLWLTFNEPKQTCLEGYGGFNKAPGYMSEGVGDYLCSHNLLKAHARAYHLYNDVYKPIHNGRVSITIDSGWFEPNTQNAADLEASERIMLFQFGWYTDPIYHPNGDYPQVMKDMVRERSLLEGFPESRLPEFTPEEIEYIRGTYDYFGLNHYSTELVQNVPDQPIGAPSHRKDARVETWYDPAWPESASPWVRVVPWGFRRLLNWIKTRYGDVEIFITENGYSDLGELQDDDRINYYQLYLSAVLDAMIEDQVNVKAYTAWSLLDNMEWREGYTVHLGLHHVDFTNPERPRTPKASATFYRDLIANRVIPGAQTP